MTDDLKRGLVTRLKQVGAYGVGVADPKDGYEHALLGRHPLELWEGCKSVIVFAVATPPKANNTYIGPYAPWRGDRNIGPIPNSIRSEEYAMDRLCRLFLPSITLQGVTYLQEYGFNVSLAEPQFKLSALESGLGVYGRSGLILHPVLGNRMRFGAILTDAVLTPNDRLEGFDPCEDCDQCIRMCPAQAYEPTKQYPESWSREKCTTRRAEIADEEFYCHNCFAVCPAGQLEDESLVHSREVISFYKGDKRRRPLEEELLP